MISVSADWVSAVAGSFATLLSAVAVVVAVRVSRETNKQTKAIASEQALREVRAYHGDRKAEFREQCRVILAASNAIEELLSPRVSELLSASPSSEDLATVRSHLAQLSAQVNLLTTFTNSSSGIPTSAARTVRELLEEAAWVNSDSLHLAILVTDNSDEEEDVDLQSPQAVVDALLNGSAVNLDPRLMPGYNPASPNGAGTDAHSEWEKAYARREVLLLESGIVTAQPRPSSLAEVAARSLGWVSIRRFADRADELLSCWGADDEGKFRFNV